MVFGGGLSRRKLLAGTVATAATVMAAVAVACRVLGKGLGPLDPDHAQSPGLVSAVFVACGIALVSRRRRGGFWVGTVTYISRRACADSVARRAATCQQRQ